MSSFHESNKEFQNTYCNLATELKECIKFKPKTWHKVYEKSKFLLHNNDIIDTRTNNSKAKHSTQLSTRRKSLISTTEYLSQPYVVQELLNGNQHVSTVHPVANPSSINKQNNNEIDTMRIEQCNAVTIEQQPLQVTLPQVEGSAQILSLKKSSSDRNLQDIPKKLEVSFSQPILNDTKELYDGLRRQANIRNCRDMIRKSAINVQLSPLHDITTNHGLIPINEQNNNSHKSQNFANVNKRERKMTPPVVKKRNESIQKYLKPASSHAQRKERIQMTSEDNNAEVYPTNLKPEVLGTNTRTEVSNISYYIKNYRSAAAAQNRTRLAENKVRETIVHLKKWIPLETQYAVGKGKFASPSHQRAAELLYETGFRFTRGNLIKAMEKWKCVTKYEKYVNERNAIIMIQCWWRQQIAMRILIARKLHQQEIRKQHELCQQFLKRKECNAACIITRFITNCVSKYQAYRIMNQHKAAIIIQKFYRHKHDVWNALQLVLQIRKQRDAAVKIQSQFRMNHALKKCKLLMRIQSNEKYSKKKKLDQEVRRQRRIQLGASIVIQRMYYKWKEARMEALHLRRLHVQYKLKCISRIQNNYRQYKARHHSTNYKVRKNNAILVLQCAWRCYRARLIQQKIIEILRIPTIECKNCGNGNAPSCGGCFHKFSGQLTSSISVISTPQTNDESDSDLIQSKMLEILKYDNLDPFCIQCNGSNVVEWECTDCDEIYCKKCLIDFHTKGQRQYHTIKRLDSDEYRARQLEAKHAVEKEIAQAMLQKELDDKRILTEKRIKWEKECATKIQSCIRSYLSRKKFRDYILLVRQTQKAIAQRLKDQPQRNKLAYQMLTLLGKEPSLESDTRGEVMLREKRQQRIRRVLHFQFVTDRHQLKNTLTPESWCFKRTRIKIITGEWINCTGIIIFAENVLIDGTITVQLSISNKEVVLHWSNVKPISKTDDMMRLLFTSKDKFEHLNRTFYISMESAKIKAQLYYYQSILYHDIKTYAWIETYNKYERRIEYWNVVTNKRTIDYPNGLNMLASLQVEYQEEIQDRIVEAKAKILNLFYPYNATKMPHLHQRRNAIHGCTPKVLKSIQQYPSQLTNDSNNSPYKSLLMELDAIESARFWQDHVIENTKINRQVLQQANTFLKQLQVSTNVSIQDCWNLMKVLKYYNIIHKVQVDIEKKSVDEYIQVFMGLPDDIQFYILIELKPYMKMEDLNSACLKFTQLLALNIDTLELLVIKKK